MITFSLSQMVIALVILFTETTPSRTLVSACIIQVIVDLAVLIALGDLMVFHIYLAWRGISTYEYIQNQRSTDASRRVMTTMQNLELPEGSNELGTKRKDIESHSKRHRAQLSDASDHPNAEFKGLISTNRGGVSFGELSNRTGQQSNKNEAVSSILKKVPVVPPVPFGPKSYHQAGIANPNIQHQRTNPTSGSSPIKLLVGKTAEDDDELDPGIPISLNDCSPALQVPIPDNKTSKSEESIDAGIEDMSHDYEHNILTAVGGGGFNGILGIQTHKPVLKNAIDNSTPLRLSQVEESEPKDPQLIDNEHGLEQEPACATLPPNSSALRVKEDHLGLPTQKEPANLESFYDSQMEASCNRERSYQQEHSSIESQDVHSRDKELKTQANPFSRKTGQLIPQEDDSSKEQVLLQKSILKGREPTLEGPSNSTRTDQES